MQGTRTRSTRKELVSSRNLSLGVISYCSQRVKLPGEVARLLSEVREENRALWREIKQLGGRIPPHIANTLRSSANSHSHSLSLPSIQGQGQVIRDLRVILVTMLIEMAKNLGAVDPVEDHRVMDVADSTSKRQ